MAVSLAPLHGSSALGPELLQGVGDGKGLVSGAIRVSGHFVCKLNRGSQAG